MTTGLALGLVGGVVGTLLGGAIGGQIGFLAGSLIGNLLDPPKVEGPRLTDLKLQVSEYGRPIPIIYGTMRIAGNLIWQTDLQEHKQTSGGKGGPETTNYTYSASFAIMLANCYIDGIDEIFADGRKVWPDTEGFDFTFYQGTEDQEPDPTMEAEIGVGLVPAHRGSSYVVFDGLDLSPYGNRIPQLEFVCSTEPQELGISVINVNYTDGVLDNPTGFGGSDSEWRYIVDWPLHGQPITAALFNQRDYLTEIYNASYHDTDTLDANGDTNSFATGQYWPDLNGLDQRTGVAQYYYPSGVGRMFLWYRNANNTVALWPFLTDADGITNFVLDAGVPGAVYPVGVAVTQDQESLFIFTSLVNGNTAPDHWYKIVDGVVTDDGTCTAGLTNLIAGGKRRVYTAGSVSVENNGRYFWSWNDSSQTANIYYLDDSGNINDWGGGSVSVPFRSNGSNPVGVETGSLHALSTDGYCGVVLGTGIALLSRRGPRPPILLSTIVSDISSRTPLDASEYDTADLTDLVPGYQVAAQMEAVNAIQPLRQAYFFDAVERDGAVVFVKRGGASAVTVDDDDLAGRAEGNEPPALLSSVRVQEAELPRRVYVEYINADFDYQKGTQYDERQITSSQSETTLTLPLNISDATAKHIAGTQVWGAYQEREAFTWFTNRKLIAYEPTDVMTVQGIDLRVEKRTEKADGTIEWSGVVSRAALYEVADDISGATASSPGQTAASERVSTTAILLDIPVISQTDSPFGFQVAMGPSADGPWSGAGLYKSLDGGLSYSLVASTSVAAVMGSTVGSPGVLGNYAGSLTSVDATNSIDVQLSSNDATLASCTQTALDNGANLCAIKSGSLWELAQFRDATLVSSDPPIYTLTNWYRGRYNTEDKIAGHASGDQFVMLPALDVDAPESELNVALKYKAVTLGKTVASATAIDFTNTGQSTDEFYDVEIRNLPPFIGDLGSPDDPKQGLVPAPAAGDCAAGKYLSACGVWSVPAGSGGSPSGGGSTSPLTTKGDIWGFTTTDARIPAGTNGWILAYNSSNANGWEYYNLAGNLDATWGRTYITVTNETLLTNERRLAVTPRLTLTDNGANSSIELDVPGLASQFLVRQLTTSLENECVLVAGNAITLTDGGGSPPTTMTIDVIPSALPGGYSKSQLFTTPGANTFNVPANVSSVRITMIGAGGGGSTTVAAATGGGGGGSGELVQNLQVNVTGGGSVTVTVGAKGTGGAAGSGSAQPGTAGGDTSFGSQFIARGGLGGSTAGASGAGGGVGGGILKAAGSPGAAGAVGIAEAPTYFGGGSGGGGGSTTASAGGAGAGCGPYAAVAGGATAASQAGGGSGASTIFGLGGAAGAGGAIGSAAPTANSGAGGGGGGGKAATTIGGGNGADGQCLVEWNG